MDKDASNSVVLALCSADKKDWNQFFEFLRQRQFQKMKGKVLPETLNEISNIVNYLYYLDDAITRIITKKDLTNVI